MRPFAYVIAVALQEWSNLSKEFTASGGIGDWVDGPIYACGSCSLQRMEIREGMRLFGDGGRNLEKYKLGLYREG
jgi:hypothetical protein